VTASITSIASRAAAAPPPAFPGAEGFGAAATGGRGREVYYVTNLNDAGPGSLRDAVSRGNRTVLFKVSGTIDLESRLTIDKPNVTIAGQTAPGDGICLKDHELFIANTENVVVRFLRVRPGDLARKEHDALTIWNSRNVIIDHCSLSWSTDSVNDVVKGSHGVTVQWCILSEALDQSVHAKGSHGYATGWGHGSYHHNLLASCASRMPRLAALPTRGLSDVRNNVIYNWGFGWAYGGEHADVNFVGNYFRAGPASQHNRVLFNPWDNNCRIYVAGNVLDGNAEVTADNRRGIVSEGLVGKGEGITSIPLDGVILDHPFPAAAPVGTQPAAEALELVLAGAGATLPKRDAVDERVVRDVRDRTGRLVNSQAEVGGWPELTSAEPPADADADGMPDDWERARDLDPNDAADGRAVAADGYTNLEHYLNELAARAVERPVATGR
jgi:pectate lyase